LDVSMGVLVLFRGCGMCVQCCVGCVHG